jgi:hypothetical protein
MRDRFGVALFSAMAGLGLAMIGLYSSCGGTGGGTSNSQAAAQAVNRSCSPPGPNQTGGNCLTLNAPNAVPADGVTLSGFRAALIGGDGAPITGVQICFRFEDARVAIIIEPTDGCGLTDANGNVSGQFQDGTVPGSFQLIAEAPPGFNLQARETISFGGNFVTPGNIGSACTDDSDCRNSFCSFGDTCFPGPSICTQLISNTTTACCADIECASGTCAGGTCQSTTTGSVPNGGNCTTSPECVSQCCDSTTGKCQDPSNPSVSCQ